MELRYWYLAAGLLLCAMAFAATLIRRLPLSTAILYIAIGWVLGPHGFGVLALNLDRHADVVAAITQAVLLVSIFSAGLKMRVPINSHFWLLSLRLAFLSMFFTVALAAVAGVYLLGLPWGLAILIGGMLAPTDPVLASDVQVENPYHVGALRFALTSEAGLNDGSAFPMVLLGLMLTTKPHTASGILHWFGLQFCWSTLAGIAVGFTVGVLMGKFILHLRVAHGQALGLEYFLAPGLIAISFALGELAHGFGFLAVFSTAVALRWIEMRSSNQEDTPELPLIAVRTERRFEAATDPETAPVFLVELLLQFTDQLERIGELVVVLIIGSLATLATFEPMHLLFVLVLFVLIRPLSVFAGLLGSKLDRVERGMIGWFGIRGAASLYYAAYAIQHGLPQTQAQIAVRVILATIAISVAVHGFSVTPLMNWYTRREGQVE